MICYLPLKETLKNRGMTLDQLADAIEYPGLRGKLNSGTYLTLKTVDTICRELKCSVSDVVEYKEGEMKPISYIKGYTIDWGKVFDLVSAKKTPAGKKMSFRLASKAMGHSKSYLHNLSHAKRATPSTVKELASFLECEISAFAEEVMS